jgi:hypothetical protein
LHRGQDTFCVAVRPAWSARTAARRIPRRILFALAVLVNFGKLASASQFEKIGTAKPRKLE